MRVSTKLLGALCAVLVYSSLALALSTVTITTNLTYPTTGQAATSLTVQSRSDGGAWVTYCTMTAPTTTCTGAAVPLGHVYDFQGFATNTFGNSPVVPVTTVNAFPPPGPGLANPPYAITVQ